MYENIDMICGIICGSLSVLFVLFVLFLSIYKEYKRRKAFAKIHEKYEKTKTEMIQKLREDGAEVYPTVSHRLYYVVYPQKEVVN